MRLMLDLASTSKNGSDTVRLGEIARRTGISQRYLNQLVLPLKNAALIRGRRGPQGGYTLARSANLIRLDQILEASIGPIGLAPCVADPDYCTRSEFCDCRLLYEFISLRLSADLASFTLADLADKEILAGMRDEIDRLKSEKQGSRADLVEPPAPMRSPGATDCPDRNRR